MLRLIRGLEKEFNRGLEDLYLMMKKEMDETKFLSFVGNISQFLSIERSQFLESRRILKSIGMKSLKDFIGLFPSLVKT